MLNGLAMPKFESMFEISSHGETRGHSVKLVKTEVAVNSDVTSSLKGWSTSGINSMSVQSDLHH